jgi:hypothetical protein
MKHTYDNLVKWPGNYVNDVPASFGGLGGRWRLDTILEYEVVNRTIVTDWQCPFHTKRDVIHTRHISEGWSVRTCHICQHFDGLGGLPLVLEGESLHPDLVMGVRLWKIG